jgi:hypothetical protein
MHLMRIPEQVIGWGLLGVAMVVPCEAPLAADLQVETALLKAETLTGEWVTGLLLRIEKDYCVIERQDGDQFIMHIDQGTRLEPVTTGDTVKAYITGTAHATALERVED